jgi:hypothetical protein
VDDPEEEMPYQISDIDTSISTDEQQTAGRLRTEEFPTEPAALARARELLEDVSYKTVLISEITTSTWGSRCAAKQHAWHVRGGIAGCRASCVAGDRGEDFAVVRWYLHCQEAAFAAAYHVEGYAHASRERFSVMASSLLGHGAGSSLPSIGTCCGNNLKRGSCQGFWG